MSVSYTSVSGSALQNIKNVFKRRFLVNLVLRVKGCIACSPVQHLCTLWYSPEGRKQYQMSGCCEYCFDALTQEYGGYESIGLLTPAGRLVLEMWLQITKAREVLRIPVPAAGRLSDLCLHSASWPRIWQHDVIVVDQPMGSAILSCSTGHTHTWDAMEDAGPHGWGSMVDRSSVLLAPWIGGDALFLVLLTGALRKPVARIHLSTNVARCNDASLAAAWALRWYSISSEARVSAPPCTWCGQPTTDKCKACDNPPLALCVGCANSKSQCRACALGPLGGFADLIGVSQCIGLAYDSQRRMHTRHSQ
jgi:hypothetical protein